MSDNDIKELSDTLKKYRYHYYHKEPLVADSVYDSLVKKLQAMDANNDFFQKPLQPQLKLNDAMAYRAHTVPIPNFFKLKDESELRNWAIGSKLGATPLFWRENLKSVTLALQYENGKLVSALTRGDGRNGVEVLANAVLCKGLLHYIEPPTSLSKPITGIIHGELFLLDRHHKKYFPNAKESMMALRDALCKRTRENSQRLSHAEFRAFDAFLLHYKFDNELEKMQFLHDRGFKTPPHGSPSTLAEVLGIHKTYVDHYKDELPYQLHGLLVRHFTQESFEKAKIKLNSPYGMAILTFPNMRKSTRLLDIEWQVGDSGRLTPVAVLEKVSLEQEVRRANLHGHYRIEELGLTKDCDVLVEMTHGRLPNILEKVSDKGGDPYLAPTHCPVCKASVFKKGKNLLCVNQHCAAIIKGDILVWQKALGVNLIHEKHITILIEQGVIKCVSDIYKMRPKQIEKALSHTNSHETAKKLSRKIWDSIHSVTTMSFESFLVGLNLKDLGKSVAKELVAHGYTSIKLLSRALPTELVKIKKLGKKSAVVICDEIMRKESTIESLLRCVTIHHNTGILEGKTFCFIDPLHTPKHVLKRLIVGSGGEVKTKVTKDLTYLVTNDPFDLSLENKIASQYALPKITEASLLAMIAGKLHD